MALATTSAYCCSRNRTTQLEILQETMDTKELGQFSLEKPHLNSREVHCSVDRCETESLVVLGGKSLCLQHFLTSCYEWLDQLDPVARDRFTTAADVDRVRSLVEECSNRALLVSLRCETLTNLDRSRLLDILLRSSDLLFLLRVPADVPAWLPVHPVGSTKTQRARKISLGSRLHSRKSYGY